MRTTLPTIGFCENGAGYGGAIISLAAFLEHISPAYQPCLYTSLGTTQYQRLASLLPWTHVPPWTLMPPERIRRAGLPFASSIDNVLNVLPTALRYYHHFKRARIDLVYLNNDANCNMAAALAARMAGLPMVLHARGFNNPTRGTRWVLAKLSHCIAVSHAVRDELVELGLPREKCSVVPEGLDLDRFCPRPPAPGLRHELGMGEHEPVITLVGGLVDWKGQDVLLDAAPAILERFPRAHILIVGAAYGRDREFAEMLAQRAAAPGLGGRVRLLGARGDIPDLLSISDIVLHTSTKPEPFGRTFLEGMAMGKAVIASNEGGPLDVIEHEVDGLLIAPRQPALLAGAVIGLLSDPQLAADMAARGALKARAFSIQSHAAQINAVLAAALHAPR